MNVPPGKYRTRVLSATTLQTGLMVVTHQIIEGKHKGKKLYHRYWPEDLDPTSELLEDAQDDEDDIYDCDDEEWDDEPPFLSLDLDS